VDFGIMPFPLLDDPTIPDDAPLWRRIPPLHVVFDHNLGRSRPSSAAFEDHPNGSPMSVVLGREVLDAGRSAQSVLLGHEGFALASVLAGFVRTKGLGIVRSPLAEEPAHAEVFGSKTDSIKKALAKNSSWVVPPPQRPDAS
jgi:hypothetical protein